MNVTGYFMRSQNTEHMYVDRHATEKMCCNSVIFGIFLEVLKRRTRRTRRSDWECDPFSPSCYFSFRQTKGLDSANCYHAVVIHTTLTEQWLFQDDTLNGDRNFLLAIDLFFQTPSVGHTLWVGCSSTNQFHVSGSDTNLWLLPGCCMPAAQAQALLSRPGSA